jgi:uncharacterized coiled-coil protein SlyX
MFTTVRYEAVNAMLLNEFLKEHCEVQEQKATITQLKSTVAQQQKDFQAAAAHQQEQIEALTAGLQKVSAQVEMEPPGAANGPQQSVKQRAQPFRRCTLTCYSERFSPEKYRAGTRAFVSPAARAGLRRDGG